MREQTKENFIKLGGRTLPINTWNGKRGCYVEMLESIDEQMTAMLSHHDKVLMVRLDVHVHDRLADNEIMTDFIDRMRRWACGKYKKNKRLGYIWCRELSSDKGLHYHLVLLLNGNEVQSHYHVLEKAQQIAEHHAHRGYRSVPHFDKNPMHMMIDRDTAGDYERAFEWASYLAKTRTKDNKHRSDRANNYQTSRIKPRLNEHGKIFTSGDDYKKAIAAKASRSKQVAPKTTATDKPLHMMTDDYLAQITEKEKGKQRMTDVNEALETMFTSTGIDRPPRTDIEF